MAVDGAAEAGGVADGAAGGAPRGAGAAARAPGNAACCRPSPAASSAASLCLMSLLACHLQWHNIMYNGLNVNIMYGHFKNGIRRIVFKNRMKKI